MAKEVERKILADFWLFRPFSGASRLARDKGHIVRQLVCFRERKVLASQASGFRPACVKTKSGNQMGQWVKIHESSLRKLRGEKFQKRLAIYHASMGRSHA
jgi:hypothetical protein